MLQRVDDDLVRGVTSRKAGDAHQTGDLTDGNVERRARHKCRDGRQGDEVDDPAASNQSNGDDDASGNECGGRSHLIRNQMRMRLVDLGHDIARDGRRNSNRLHLSALGEEWKARNTNSDGDIFRGSKEPVDEHAHKGRIETKLG